MELLKKRLNSFDLQDVEWSREAWTYCIHAPVLSLWFCVCDPKLPNREAMLEFQRLGGKGVPRLSLHLDS